MSQQVRSAWVRRFWLARPYTFIGAILVIVLAVPVLRHDQDWMTVYVPAAARLAGGEDVFRAGSGFVYPPVNAWLPLPFLALPRAPALLLWHALNMAALATLLLGAWKLSGGGPLEGAAKAPWREHVIFWLGLACGISSCLDAVTNQQTDLIVAALVILGCMAIVWQREWRGGIWFGIAAGIKCTPLLWGPYLAWRKRWAAAFLVIAVAAAINLLPDLTHPPPNTETRLGDWARRFLQPMATREHEMGSWTCGVGGNQSLAGIWQRWLVYDTTREGTDLLGTPSPARVTPATLRIVSACCMLLLLAAGLACAWKSSAAANAPLPATLSLQFGMVLILMVLWSPHSSKPHFCTLLLPGFCVARAALNWPNRRLLIVLAAAVLLALVSNQDLVGTWIYSWAKWHGSLAWCAVFLYGASCRILLEHGRSASGNAVAAPVVIRRHAA